MDNAFLSHLVSAFGRGILSRYNREPLLEIVPSKGIKIRSNIRTLRDTTSMMTVMKPELSCRGAAK